VEPKKGNQKGELLKRTGFSGGSFRSEGNGRGGEG